MMSLFRKKKNLEEMVREWTRKIRGEERVLERRILNINLEEKKIKRKYGDSAKKGQTEACRILEEGIVHSKKNVSKLYEAKAQLGYLSNQLATAGSLDINTDVMKSMQALIKVPEIRKTMLKMSKEMIKAGIIKEMLEDSDEMEDAA